MTRTRHQFDSLVFMILRLFYVIISISKRKSWLNTNYATCLLLFHVSDEGLWTNKNALHVDLLNVTWASRLVY